jgi:drug/metabolite transporter (DMT)-like permease
MFTILPIMAETASPVIAGFVVAVVVILQFLLWHSVLSYGPKISDVFWCFLFSVMICLFGFICYKIAMSETHPKILKLLGFMLMAFHMTRHEPDQINNDHSMLLESTL